MFPRILLILISSLISFSLMAQEYGWKPSHGSQKTVIFSSATAACTSIFVGDTSFDKIIPHATVAGNYRCFYRSGTSTTSYEYGSASRSGTTCAFGTTYNSTLGQCEAPPPSQCESDAGRSFPYSKSGTWPDAFIEVFTVTGKLSYGTQQTACSSGCQIETIAPACKVGTDGTYTCRGEALTTGAECVTGTGDALDPGDPEVFEGDTTLPPPVPETIVEQVPCTYGIDSTVGGLKCVSSSYVEKEGTACGIFNGQNVCVTKQPVSNDTQIETTIVETSNPDGSTTSTKTDTATTTTCVGAQCETKTGSTSTTTSKDPGGNTTGSSTTCVGLNCTGNSSTGGDSGGECLADCDPVDDFSTPDLDEVASFGDSVTAFTGRIAAAPLLANISSIGMTGSGSCSFPSASTMIGEINFNSICTNSGWLDPLFYVFLALWAFAAVRVLLSA
jgi:hypothetical protein